MKYGPIIIVHGGAFTQPISCEEDSIKGCIKAAAIGCEILKNGEHAVLAVHEAVKELENNPIYEAGYGSHLNYLGDVEMDAMIMNGEDLSFGSVAALKDVKNPITLAKCLMDTDQASMLVGEGARLFAKKHKIHLCSKEDLTTEQELERWKNSQKNYKNFFGHNFTKRTPSDTVGAVALDMNGNLAAATSTGGTENKIPGRVGDAPLIGCGAYANNRSGAASATGQGELLMRMVISKSVCDLIGKGLRPKAATEQIMSCFEKQTKGHGGLIVLDANGDFGISHNTPFMTYAIDTIQGNYRESGIKY